MLDKKFWKKYFTVYDTLCVLIPYKDLLEKIVSKVLIQRGGTVLDLGSGTGNLASLLTMNGYKVVGIDSSCDGNDIYKAKVPNSEVICYDINNKLPFPNNYFDAVCSNNVLYTIKKENRIFILGELNRILKPNGIIVISNIKIGFKPIMIYFQHIKMFNLKYGLFRTAIMLIKFLPNTIKIFYYNYLINKEGKTGTYSLFEPGEQKKLLEKCGFSEISDDISVYASQGILNYAKK